MFIIENSFSNEIPNIKINTASESLHIFHISIHITTSFDYPLSFLVRMAWPFSKSNNCPILDVSFWISAQLNITSHSQTLISSISKSQVLLLHLSSESDSDISVHSCHCVPSAPCSQHTMATKKHFRCGDKRMNRNLSAGSGMGWHLFVHANEAVQTPKSSIQHCAHTITVLSGCLLSIFFSPFLIAQEWKPAEAVRLGTYSLQS